VWLVAVCLVRIDMCCVLLRAYVVSVQRVMHLNVEW
jgi:hypothetical protein